MMSLPLTIVTLLSIVVRTEAEKEMECGQRLTAHTPLMTFAATAEHWPWHAAIYYRRVADSELEYQCGGTVITATSVLTAAHCVWGRYSKIETNLISVSLGRLTLSPNEWWAQSFEVAKIDVHPHFLPMDLSNDIAIIQLATVATFNNYVRPICLWNATRTDLSDVVGRNGTVIGFGFTENYTVSMELREASMPVVSDDTCRASNPSFFGPRLKDTNFCAGIRNGTSVCRGDSGGSMSFEINGAYYIRGIFSVVPAIINKTTLGIRCDSTHYAMFTDVAKFVPWIHITAAIGCKKDVVCQYNESHHNRCEIFLDLKLWERKCKILFSGSANAGVTWLKIRGELEALGDLSDAVDKFENLVTLHLSGTELQTVERANFEAFGRLERLDLTGNSITSIAADTFDDLTNLKTLHLRSNELEEIHADTFAKLANLASLDLSRNKLEIIPEGLFRDNLRLDTIWLENNRIKAIHRNVFSKLVSLQYLCLSDNRINKIHGDLFKKLANLTYLDLDGNELEILPEGLFRKNLRLEKIYLSNNKIEKINRDLFVDLFSLKYLQLHGNKIKTLPGGLFRFNINLQRINLANNKLEKIGSDFKKNLTSLMVLDLGENICID